MPTLEAANDIEACRVCGQVHEVPALPRGAKAYCVRCGARLSRHVAHGLSRTAAFSLAALLLYLPANFFPILGLDIHGLHSDNTVWQGTVSLYNDGDWFIALIVLLASIVIPVLKLLGLFFLVASVALKMERARGLRTWLYRAIELLGRWAMLDVFVMAILVSLVKLGKLATVIPGKGLFAFTCVVVCTLLASASFDPHLIWKNSQGRGA